MTSKAHRTIHRYDYQPFPWLVKEIHLLIQHFTGYSLVTSRMSLKSIGQQNPAPLRLNGERLELLSVAVDDRILAENEYQFAGGELVYQPASSEFSMKIVTKIHPDGNTALEGIYRSGGMYCSQCEAEGFRTITCYPDRPDVLSVFTTRIEADKKSCPVLLAGGNLIASGDLADGRHYAAWHDPFPKPAYLFATVAGKLACIEDNFLTKSGRKVALRIYVEDHNKEKCGHAMASLQKAMRWDEEVYGLEYDLDNFMIVAVEDFNMGAMENKGLNIFNAKNIVASPDTATDLDYQTIEAVVAHEYFHNWTGNRITCRDWFQLSLKEGLTVFRDQQFSADMQSPAAQRIDDVRILRAGQFREDSGPMAHAVRPDSYVEINNFYTATVYNKGAEVVRMLHTFLGEAGYHGGMDLYVARHDGQAVTCDDFLAAMQDANPGHDLRQFALWYSQAGTPRLTVREEYEGLRYRLIVEQSTAPTPGQPEKKPLHIPLAVGLLTAAGVSIPINGQETTVLHLSQGRQEFVWDNIRQKPVLSFLRNFSAPVIVEPFQSRADLLTLMAHDHDPFNRWDAAARLAEETILAGVAALAAGKMPVVGGDYLAAMRNALTDKQLDSALKAQMLQLPSESYLATRMEVVQPDALWRARRFLRQQLATSLKEEFLAIYYENEEFGAHDLSATAMGRRGLQNSALSYLMAEKPLTRPIAKLCRKHYWMARNMTVALCALQLAADSYITERNEIINDFAKKWQHDALVMDKWFSAQALSSREDTLTTVAGLLAHPAFSMRNPNKVRALIGAFASGNHYRFHAEDGQGYLFLADRILDLQADNPQIAARLAAPLTFWRYYDENRQKLMRAQLERILRVENLSRDVYEITRKSLE
ncbi:MAG: aminopeptidase N [Desulfobulbaceae bacterium]|jgi:aminopeptidase N|nr:aminopeptidase N [Desulfobulbaceae bacterium]